MRHSEGECPFKENKSAAIISSHNKATVREPDFGKANMIHINKDS